MKPFDWQGLAIRALLVLAGGVAAALLVLKGQGPAVPALAVGATLGAVVMGRLGVTKEG
jgi:hypothetical protein